MRLTTVRLGAGTSAARVEGDVIVVLPDADVGTLVASGPDWLRRAHGPGEELALANAYLAPVIPRPEKIICVGLNYEQHVHEIGLPRPEYPTLFGKFARSLIGAYDDLVLPENSSEVDWEVELGVVVGSFLRQGSLTEARAAIAGYTVFNDVSMRDWQRRTSQFLQGKTFEGSTPVGPWLVTADELGDGSGLALTCRVGDRVMQSSTTSDMVFSAAEIVAYISQFITLVPGDLIATGTPSGVGGAMDPPVFLKAEDVLVSEIEGIGMTRNRCTTRALAPIATSRS